MTYHHIKRVPLVEQYAPLRDAAIEHKRLSEEKLSEERLSEPSAPLGAARPGWPMG